MSVSKSPSGEGSMHTNSARTGLMLVGNFAVTWVSQTDSTNAELLLAARQGAPANSVLVADYQRAGKGRLARSWVAAPSSGLLFSVLLRPQLAVTHASLITLALALSASEACEHVAGVRPLLKWPNDLVVENRKLAGILAESLVSGSKLLAIVVGMGLNVNSVANVNFDVERTSTAFNNQAVGLADVCDKAVDRRVLLSAILERFGAWMDGIELANKQQALLAVVRKWSATLGQPVSVTFTDGSIATGVVKDIDQRGGLLLADGTQVTTADVMHLRKVP